LAKESTAQQYLEAALMRWPEEAGGTSLYVTPAVRHEARRRFGDEAVEAALSELGAVVREAPHPHEA